MGAETELVPTEDEHARALAAHDAAIDAFEQGIRTEATLNLARDQAELLGPGVEFMNGIRKQMDEVLELPDHRTALEALRDQQQAARDESILNPDLHKLHDEVSNLKTQMFKDAGIIDQIHEGWQTGALPRLTAMARPDIETSLRTTGDVFDDPSDVEIIFGGDLLEPFSHSQIPEWDIEFKLKRHPDADDPSLVYLHLGASEEDLVGKQSSIGAFPERMAQDNVLIRGALEPISEPDANIPVEANA